jgi:hypothetical protein
MSAIFSSNKTVSTAVSVGLGNLYNPWSLSPFSPISYQLYNTQNGVTRVTQSCSGLSQTNTAMNTFTSFSVTATLTTISAVGNFKLLSFTTKNPIPVTGGQLRVCHCL